MNIKSVYKKKSFIYKFSLIPLDDIAVVPLVLLHSHFGVLHINVVRQVIH